jgi:hypothetical protein
MILAYEPPGTLPIPMAFKPAKLCVCQVVPSSPLVSAFWGSQSFSTVAGSPPSYYAKSICRLWQVVSGISGQGLSGFSAWEEAPARARGDTLSSEIGSVSATGQADRPAVYVK